MSSIDRGSVDQCLLDQGQPRSCKTLEVIKDERETIVTLWEQYCT